MNKKGFVTIHAGMFFIAGLIIGAVVMYFAIARGLLPIGIPTP